MNTLKQVCGWLILVAVLGGLVVLTAMAFGWGRAAIVWGVSLVASGALLLAIAWITD